MKLNTGLMLIFLFAIGGLLGACDSKRPSSTEAIDGSISSASDAIDLSSPSPSPPALGTIDPVDELLLDLESTPVRFVYPTPVANAGPDWRPPPYEIPLSLRPEDHFYFKRPIPSGDVNWPNPSYRYGYTFFSDSTVHTGVDLGADKGADVVAAGDGEVIWVGYGLFRGYEDRTDPYGLAVAIRHTFGHVGEPLYTIYAHLESTEVWLGQPVLAGEKIGTVGITGHTTGPHLHFEVRLGKNDYFSTRNPELWMVPPEGWAVLAGRVMNSYGYPLTEHAVEITSLENGKKWNVKTYRATTIHPDDEYQENFVISDLPSGPYEIRINYYGVNLKTQLFLFPGRTNFVEFLGWKGYTLEDAPVDVELIEPPVP
jgi:murein DD-endopeptidase MepM/ murein hydrolase activator NlpD